MHVLLLNVVICLHALVFSVLLFLVLLFCLPLSLVVVVPIPPILVFFEKRLPALACVVARITCRRQLRVMIINAKEIFVNSTSMYDYSIHPTTYN